MKLWHPTAFIALFLLGFLAEAVSTNPPRDHEPVRFPLKFAYSAIDTQIVSDEIVYLKGYFPFINEADTPVVIRNVKAAYGGMTTTYHRQPILPKQRDTIWYYMRFWKDFRGPFSKAITVVVGSSSPGNTQMLHVKGRVTGPHDPKLVFLQHQMNLDTVPVGTVRKLKFYFTNQGSGPLIIENVKVSCNILTPGWQHEVFEPGDTGFVYAIFHANVVGRFDKSISVYSNDPRNKATVLRVKAVGQQLHAKEGEATPLNLFKR